jgi:hypothetical protein
MEARADVRTARFLRVDIAAQWTAAEFAESLYDLSRLHDFSLAFWERRDPDLVRQLLGRQPTFTTWEFSWNLRRYPVGAPLLRGPLDREAQLEVVRLDYSSPGFADLAGVGKTVEQIRLFLQYLIDLAVWRKQRRAEITKSEVEVQELELQLKKLDQEILAMRIENVRQLLNLKQEAEATGARYEDLRDGFLEVEDIQTRMLNRIDQGQITGVQTLDEDAEPGVEA